MSVNFQKNLRISPGRSKAFHYGDFDSDGETDAALAVALAQSQTSKMGDDELDFQTSLETSQLGASTAKHEHITLPPSPTPDDDSKTQDIIGELLFSVNRRYSGNRHFSGT